MSNVFVDNLSEVIARHLYRTPMLAKPVHEMTGEELDIYKVASYHREFLRFLIDSNRAAASLLSDQEGQMEGVAIVKDVSIERDGENVMISQRFSFEKMDDVICVKLEDVPALLAALHYEIEEHQIGQVAP